MAIACPLRSQGVIGGVFLFDAQICPNGGIITARANRDHTLGVDCNNILDPISVAIPVLAEGLVRGGGAEPAPFGCACAHTGLKAYTTMDSPVLLAPGFDVSAEHVVQYVDKNDDGHYVERLARVFVLKGGARRKPVLIGQELAPGTRVSGVLAGELKHCLGHSHTVMTGKGLAHIVTKSYLQPMPAATRGNGASRGRGGRSTGKKRGRK